MGHRKVPCAKLVPIMILSTLLVIAVVGCLLVGLVYVAFCLLAAIVYLLALLAHRPRLVLGAAVLVWACWLVAKHLSTP